MSVRRWGTVSSTPYSGDIPEILKSQALMSKVAGGAVLKAGTAAAKPGTFLRRLTSGGDQYYWVPSKVAMVDSSLGTPTTTVFWVRNPAFLAGDAITVGAANATVLSVEILPSGNGKITLTAALGAAPANGARVFSQTAAENNIDGIADDFIPTLADSDQHCGVYTSGIFKKDYFDLLYHATDITAWGALAQAAHNAYRWS